MSSQSHQGTPSPGESNDASSANIADSETPRRRQGPSEYQLQREANIAENQQLLARLGLSGGGSSAILGNLPTEKGKEKEKGYVLHCLSNYILTFL